MGQGQDRLNEKDYLFGATRGTDKAKRQPPLPCSAPSVPAETPAEKPAKVQGYGTIDLLDDTGHVRPFGEIERVVIEFALSHYGGYGNRSEAARRLRIGRSTLYRKIDEYPLH